MSLVIFSRMTINGVCASACHREEQFEKLEGKIYIGMISLNNDAFPSKNMYTKCVQYASKYTLEQQSMLHLDTKFRFYRLIGQNVSLLMR